MCLKGRSLADNSGLVKKTQPFNVMCQKLKHNLNAKRSHMVNQKQEAHHALYTDFNSQPHGSVSLVSKRGSQWH